MQNTTTNKFFIKPNFSFTKIKSKPILCLISFLIFTNIMYAGTCPCSTTSMSIATQGVNTFITTNISNVRANVQQIIAFYRNEIRKKNIAKNTLIKQNLDLDIKINLLLKELSQYATKEEFHEFIKVNHLTRKGIN